MAVEDAWRARLSEITKGLSITEGRLLESEKIFIDLKENFAGRIDEAQPALEVLLENLGRSANESNALAQLLESASQDLRSGLNTLSADSDDLLASAVPTAPVQAKPAPVPSTQTGRGVVAAIQSNEAVPLSTADRFGPTIESSVAQVGQEAGSDEMIQRLPLELAASKSVQTELSADTSDLQGDLRKAYREIVSLQANLKDSQMWLKSWSVLGNLFGGRKTGVLRPHKQSASKLIAWSMKFNKPRMICVNPGNRFSWNRKDQIR